MSATLTLTGEGLNLTSVFKQNKDKLTILTCTDVIYVLWSPFIVGDDSVCTCCFCNMAALFSWYVSTYFDKYSYHWSLF